jgi:alkyldihydroxyacetonephosphate synthase
MAIVVPGLIRLARLLVHGGDPHSLWRPRVCPCAEGTRAQPVGWPEPGLSGKVEMSELVRARRRDATRRSDGWGFAGQEPTAAEVQTLAALLAARFPAADLRPAEPAAPAALPPTRLSVPGALAAFSTTDEQARRQHALGRSYADVVRAAGGAQVPAPDVVAVPRDANEVAAVLDWCAEGGYACIPFGGGTSVVGGVNPPTDAPAVVTLQTRAMDQVLDIDERSLAARIEAGATGPIAEAQLRAHGLTLRFYPQSFELSTVGGWIATRAGGHFATGPTHIDDLVESVTAVTPIGTWASRRLPASGAGPSPDRFLLGSEGTLGVITEAWVRVQPRPVHRAGAAVRFADFTAGAEAVRAIVQAGLQPANCRLLDPMEALLNGAADGSDAILIIGFESAHEPVTAQAEAALAVARDAGGVAEGGVRVRAGSTTGSTTGGASAEEGGGASGGDDAPEGAWRSSFLRAPYLRDGLVGLGMISETFETAVTWDGLATLHAEVTEAVTAALSRVCGDGIVTCRLTHAYADGAAPYFTVIAPGRRGAQIAQWHEVKAAASEALLAAGGTITHHHAVGRDHRPWYDRQRPEVFASALEAAKRAVDPAGILNPGVLLG